MPASVPPVPMAQVKPSILPSVCRQISGPVEFDMRLPVGEIVELVRPDRAVGFALRQLLGEAAGKFLVVVRVAVGDGRHFDQLGAEKRQRVLLLLALRVGDDDHGAEAERIADDGKPDTRIARSAFDDHAAGFQRAARHCVAHDPERRAVLHGLPGIHELGLAQDLAAGEFRRAFQANKGCIPYRGQRVLFDVHKVKGGWRSIRT